MVDFKLVIVNCFVPGCSGLYSTWEAGWNICLRRRLLYSITARTDSKETEDPAYHILCWPCSSNTCKMADVSPTV